MPEALTQFDRISHQSKHFDQVFIHKKYNYLLSSKTDSIYIFISMSISINTLYDFNGLITFVNFNNLIKHSLLFVCFSISFINARIIYIFPLHYIIFYMSLICQMKSYFKNFCDVHITFWTNTEKN